MPFRRIRIRLLATNAGINENKVVPRPHEVGNNGHDQTAGSWAQCFRHEPLPIRLKRLGSCLVEEFGRVVDRNLVLDYALNGTLTQACGNEDLEMHPHGVYPCAGEDRWVAIAVRSDAEWRALCDEMKRSDLASRRDERDVVEAALRDWTQPRKAGEIASALQARNVPCHEVLDTTGLFACSQLQHRGHYVPMEHEIYQTTTIESSRLRLSRSPARVPESALNFGRDNREVLERILGYSPDRIADLAERGILT